MKYFLLLICIFSGQLRAQQQNNRSRSELGIIAGGSNYIGDLNPDDPMYNIKPAGGIIYRYNLHSRLCWRGTILYGSVGASDADASNKLLKNRNLSFQSTIYEFGGGLEFSYLPFQLGHNKHRGTAYLMAGISVFLMNPMTEYKGELIELQPIGTEGQGTNLNTHGYYPLTQVSIPLGVGVKFSIGERSSIGLEYGLRKTFTDHLDDVGSNVFVDGAALTKENGPLAAELANRNLDGSRYGKRGTASTKDWYAVFGLVLTLRLGKPNKCFHQ